jgi:hypothetical protein
MPPLEEIHLHIPYLVAAIIALATGLAHSVLGERLVFRRLRKGGLVPTEAAPPLQARHVRILWATWHLASLFGWAFAGLLFQLALGHAMTSALVAGAAVFANLGGSLLVLFGTRGRHPGWIALAAVAMATLAGAG